MLDSILKTESGFRAQQDTGFVDDLRYNLGELKRKMEDMKSNGTLKYDYVIANSVYRETMDNVATILLKRFGINFRVLSNVFFSDIGTFVTPPPRYGIYDDDASRKLLKNIDNIKTLTSSGKFYEYESNMNNVDSDFKKSVKALDEKFRTDNIFIDFEKGRVNNLPENYVVYIIWNPMLLCGYDDLESTIDELISAFIHEVGHTIDMLVRTVSTTKHIVDIMDTIKTEVDVRGNSLAKGLKIAYKNITGKDTESQGVLNIGIELTDSINKPYGYDGGAVSIKSKERMADSFAAKFGLGESLASFELKRAKYYGIPKANSSVLANTLIISSIYSTVLGIISSTLLPVGVGVAVGYYFSYLLVSGLITIMLNNSTENTYDDPKRRIIKLKQDLIKQLKVIKKDKNTDISSIKKRIENEIEGIDNLLEYFNKNKKEVTRVITDVKKASSKGRISFNYLMDDLIDNDLHYLVEKI